MSLFLAGLLVRGGVLTPEVMEQALQRQTREGGSLDTNLLELGVVEEEALCSYLSRASGLPVAPKGSLDAPASALRNLLPLRLLERHAVVPFGNEDREVRLACAHPMEATHLDEMALLLSQRIVAYVAPEFRIRRAIALLHDEPIPARFQELLDRLGLGSVGSGEARGEAGARSMLEVGLDGSSFEGAQAAAVSPKEISAGSSSRSALKLSMEEALAWLASTTDRDEALDVLLRFTAANFSFAASLVVQGRLLIGRDALVDAPGAAERMKGLSFTLDEPSVLERSVETGGRYLGPLAEHDPARRLSEELGRPAPRVVLVQPIMIGSRAVALLYAENGEEELAAGRADLVMQVAQAVGRKLEQLIHARKSAAAITRKPGSAPATPGSGRPEQRTPSQILAPVGDGGRISSSAGAELFPIGSKGVERLLASRSGEELRTSSSAGADLLPIGSKGVERLLASRSEEELRTSVAALEPLGGLAAALLISLLPGEGSRRGRGLSGAHRVVSALEVLGDVALPALRQAAASPSPQIRYEVARLIRRCREGAADPTLIVLSSDEDPEVAAAAQGLS